MERTEYNPANIVRHVLWAQRRSSDGANTFLSNTNSFDQRFFHRFLRNFKAFKQFLTMVLTVGLLSALYKKGVSQIGGFIRNANRAAKENHRAG
jgi:hypothetical protein